MNSAESIGTICFDGGLETFLRSVEACPSQWSQVVICSPFVDEPLRERIAVLSVRARVAGCGVRLLTTKTESRPQATFVRGAQTRVLRVSAVPRLHAKVYLALARDHRKSVAIITSANLTDAGLHKNVEFGIALKATSPEGARIVEDVRRFLESIAITKKER